jgi:hypothetical protein
MRILLSFIIGLLLFFYLGELLSYFNRLLHQKFKFPIFNHSILGLSAMIVGMVGGLLYSTDALAVMSSSLLLGSGLGLVAHHLMSDSFILFKKQEQQFAQDHEKGFDRFFEILPGALMWLVITSPLWLSFALPFAVAYIILLADVYWLVSAFRISVLVIMGYRNMEKVKKIDWEKKLEEDFPDQWENYYHLLVLPTYNESLEILLPAFNAVVSSKYPKKKIFLAVGFEERMQIKDPEGIKQKVAAVEKLSQKIGGAFATIHPLGLAGEIPGPGTNRNWMVNSAVKEFKKMGIKPEEVLVTTLDADFVIHPQFLAGSLHKYLSTPAEIRDKRSYTGAFLYFNNYWDCPTPMRLIASGTAYWQLAEMVGSDKYINFSSLSMNMQSLLDVGLWIPNKVNDDSGFYWKAYYHFKGDYKVIPHYLPITADTVLDVNLVKSFENQYKQLQRWAYGVEHVPFIIKQYFRSQDLDFWDKTDKLLFILWSYAKWGTLALFITFAGYLVPIINPSYTQSVVAYNLPVISSWILTGAFIGLFTTIYVHEKTVPPRPKDWSFLQKFWSYIQWALVPLILVSIASIPAIDAQTRLMLGKYIEYRTTNKARVS